MKNLLIVAFVLMGIGASAQKHVCTRTRPFNDYYCCDDLNKVAFPLGGIGAGMICMDGNGGISHVSIDNQPDIFNEPYAYAALMVKGVENGAKVLQTQVPFNKVFGMPNTGRGGTETSYGLPRFQGGEFLPRFPFASLKLEDNDIPLEVEVEGWSPFIPGDEDNSSLPVAIFEYRFKNTEAQYHCLIFPLTSTLFDKLEFSTYFLMAERAGIIEGYGTNSGLMAPKSLGFFRTLIVRSMALTASCHLLVNSCLLSTRTICSLEPSSFLMVFTASGTK